ncbi:MAG: 3-hydroxy-3-methylglutaryl CoA synthase [Chloroflexi bacterium]|nr:3-hydroxy-3-methylglutaryl CoA synthase [Chloroflexota bacterium]
MAGITSYGAYIPWNRLSRADIAKAWGGFAAQGEKAIANWDEDSLTMAVAAALDCLKGVDRSAVDGLFFATTSSPYREKQAASTIALATDLRREARCVDLDGSLRGASTGITLALDGVKSGSARSVLVTAADSRMGAAQGEFEQLLGDAAAAVLIGNKNVIATVEDTYTVTNEFIDLWRSAEDGYVRSWEDRFILGEGYTATVSAAVKQFMSKHKLTPKAITKFVAYGPDLRTHQGLAKSLGFEPAQTQDTLINAVGNSGAAEALLMLVAALEEAKAGDTILFSGYGDGSDVILFKVTPEIEKARDHRGVKGYINNKKVMPSYQKYLKWRGMIPTESARRPAPIPPSVTAMWREQKKNLSLYGAKCMACGKLQFPPQVLCVYCQDKGMKFEDVRMAEKQAKVFTFTHDYLAASIDPPTTVTVVDFEGGGRGAFECADRDIAEIKIDTPVEMTFRKVSHLLGIHNYYWKTRPVR